MKLIVDDNGQFKFLQVICGRHTEDNLRFGNKFTGGWRSCKGGTLIDNKIIEKLIVNVQSWHFYAGGTLKEVPYSAGLTVQEILLFLFFPSFYKF